MEKIEFSADAVRDDFVPREDYFDMEFARHEAENLWPRVWQIACRLEEIRNVGDYVTYDILKDSIIVVRSAAEKVSAFHNSCPHRGTLLTQGSGNARQFVCSFHGWRFHLDGRCLKVIDRHDWGACLTDHDTQLAPVSTGIWGGWVWINMDPDCQPLNQFLEPMASYCRKFEFEKLRLAWYKSTLVEANWKTVIEAFTEFYHVQTTHAQMLPYTDDYSTSRGMGRHGWISYSAGSGLPLGRSPRLPVREEPDFRNLVLECVEQFKDNLKALQPERAYRAAQRLRTEVAPDASPTEVLTRWGQFVREAAEETGSGWPEDLTPEYIVASGFDWHVFPNTVFLHTPESVLWYRMRPNGPDPESSIFDIWSLERFAPGTEPKVQREFYPDWRAVDWPLIYKQDLQNIPKIQRGMRSRGFAGARPSPIQERAISNFHRVLRRFMIDPHADDGLGPEPLVRGQPMST
ncbi:MAG: aromatic ring-hydroxylating dioxygenase subunit alpha [Steroidobacteraceae bacterium]